MTIKFYTMVALFFASFLILVGLYADAHGLHDIVQIVAGSLVGVGVIYGSSLWGWAIWKMYQ